MNSHHDAPSEDGLDDAPPCPSAYMTSDKRMLIFSDKADAMEWDDSKDLLPLYSLDELNRIVAAKDAEIAKFKEANRELGESNVRRRNKIVELMQKLDAQPARQVGGDEREAFEGAASALLYFLNRTAISDEYVVPETQTACLPKLPYCLHHRALLGK